MATAVLFNIGRMLSDEAPEDDPLEGDEVLDEEGRHLIEDDAGSVKLRGQAERDRLCNNMRM